MRNASEIDACQRHTLENDRGRRYRNEMNAVGPETWASQICGLWLPLIVSPRSRRSDSRDLRS